MNGMILRSVAVFLMMGLAFWGPALPSAFAQLEITPEIRQACEQFEPEIREIALTEIVPEIEADPEGQEARIVEASAATIHEANQAVADLPVPDQAALEATLTQNAGVDPVVAQALAADAQKALTEMKAAFSAGDPIKADALAKAFQAECQTRGVDPSAFGAGKEAGGMTTDRLLGGRDVTETALKAHFETAMREVFQGGTEGGAAAGMREMMEKMRVSGVNPGEVMRGGEAGEMGTPPKEMLDAMSTTEKAMFEAWKSGDTATLEKMHMEGAMKAGMEAGMSPERIAAEMGQMKEMMGMEAKMAPDQREAMMREMTSEQREVMMKEMDPRSESSGFSETTFVAQGGGGGTPAAYGDGHAVCPDGTVHQPGVEQGPGHCS